MKRRLILLTTFLVLMLSGLVTLGYAQAEAATDSEFAEGVIVVPKGTQVTVNPDESVTITNCPVNIEAGDTFVVYLQDMPLGYVAETVTTENDCLSITGGHADPAIYNGIKQSGTVKLTANMYSFEPASEKGGAEFSILDVLKYEDGKLTVGIGDESTRVEVMFSNMALNFQMEDMDLRASVSGDWQVDFIGSTAGTPLGDIPIGEIRVFGIGKIALKINFSFAAKVTVSGSFAAGVEVKNYIARPFKYFSSNKNSFGGEGTLSLSLKLTAGLDFLIAEANVYAEIGVKTVQKGKITYHEDREPHEVRCTDFKVYMFSNVGAQVRYLNKEAADIQFPIWDDDSSPAMLNFHIENGVKVPYCSEGMDTTTVEEHFGGFVTDFETVFDSLNERTVYVGIALPCDYTVDGDLFIGDGGIDLNGYKLTINGNLIQTAGEIKVGEGELIVNGNYELVRETNDTMPRNNDEIKLSFTDGSATVTGNFVHAQGEVEMQGGTLNIGGDYEMHRKIEENHYSDSTGWLTMRRSDGSITIGGDLLLQSNSAKHMLTAGTIHIAGNLTQSRTQAGTTSHFSGLWDFTVDLLPGHDHTLYFDDPENNALSILTFADDLICNSGISIGHMDLGGHSFIIHGDLIKNNTAYHAEDHLFILNGGTLTVEGDFRQTEGYVQLKGGRMNIGGDYIAASAGSDWENGIYEHEYYTKMDMEDPKDEVHIGGDLIDAGGANSLREGVIYIGGDFHDYYGSYSSYENHRTVFNGTGRQTIAFENANGGFNIVEFENTDICLGGKCLRGFTLNDDLQLTLATSALELRGTVDLNGHTLNLPLIEGDFTLTGGRRYETGLILNGAPVTITGNLYLQTALSLNGSDVTVKGDIRQSYESVMDIGSGRLTTEGNYRIASESFDENNNNSQEYYSYIKMEEANGEIHIGGELINAGGADSLREGVIYISGDFHDYYGSYSSYENHRTVFNGTELQTIVFENPNGGFATLVLNQNPELYQFSPKVCWQKIVLNQVPDFNDPTFILPENMTVLEESALEGTYATAVFVPDRCEKIGPYAFRDSELRRIRIPANCEIPASAFDGCGLVLVYSTPGSMAETVCEMLPQCVFATETNE